MHPARRSLLAASTCAGVVLGATVTGLGVLRRAKGFHPRGHVVDAVLDVPAEVPELGSLGRPGRSDVLARFSDGAGLPPRWPDVRGLAVRLPGPVDLLLASGGPGPIVRHLPLPRRRRSTVMTSLVPFRSAAGPVLLAARPTPDPLTWQLARARGTGRWRVFATLRCSADPWTAPDRAVRFDPVRHAPAGLPAYRWAAELRRFAYAWSQRYVPAL